MAFPERASLTVTNKCNLNCRMCGQWSDEGYMHGRPSLLKTEMAFEDWKPCIDELADNGIDQLLLRGGETFLYPDIIGLLEYINSKGIFSSIDTNGTQIGRFAEDIVRIGNIHLTISVDGPEAIHDAVRGREGTFRSVKEGLTRLREVEEKEKRQISTAINFTISGFSYRGLGAMPAVARDLAIGIMSIVPFYYFPEHVGRLYEAEMDSLLGCKAYSWRGFHHDESGVDVEEFLTQYRAYRDDLGAIYSYPYMDFSEEDYRTWFADPSAQVGPRDCKAVEKWLDIQPSGDVNFCVDFPDYIIGNVRESSIAEIWNSDRARRFREVRRRDSLAICYRCGAKYMSE